MKVIGSKGRTHIVEMSAQELSALNNLRDGDNGSCLTAGEDDRPLNLKLLAAMWDARMARYNLLSAIKNLPSGLNSIEGGPET